MENQENQQENEVIQYHENNQGQRQFFLESIDAEPFLRPLSSQPFSAGTRGASHHCGPVCFHKLIAKHTRLTPIAMDEIASTGSTEVLPLTNMASVTIWIGSATL